MGKISIFSKLVKSVCGTFDLYWVNSIDSWKCKPRRKVFESAYVVNETMVWMKSFGLVFTVKRVRRCLGDTMIYSPFKKQIGERDIIISCC